jgi:hypothetical protein
MSTILKKTQKQQNYGTAPDVEIDGLDGLVDIAPVWAKRIEKHGQNAFDIYRAYLCSFSLCIVGESHRRNGGDSSYDNCGYCESAGTHFAASRQPLKYIPAFVRHFKKYHLAKTKRSNPVARAAGISSIELGW